MNRTSMTTGHKRVVSFINWGRSPKRADIPKEIERESSRYKFHGSFRGTYNNEGLNTFCLIKFEHARRSTTAEHIKKY